MSVEIDHFREAVQRVLRHSTLSATTRTALTNALNADWGLGEREIAKKLIPVLGESDFNWPWFDEWLSTFQTTKKWPENPSWSWFEGVGDLPTAPDVVRSLKKDALLVLAKKKGVAFEKTIKVTELRTLLLPKVRRSDVTAEIATMTAEAAAALKIKQHQAKRMLLVSSINSCAFNLFRYDQVCDLLQTTRFRKIRLDRFSECRVSRRLSKDWLFDERSNLNFPPFFPGDHTGISAAR